MDKNIENFKKEYFSGWESDHEYEEAYRLHIKYQYECERYDRLVSNGRIDENGFIRLLSGYELRESNKFARQKRMEIEREALEKGITREYFMSAKKDIDRMKFDYIQKEYERLFQ